MIAAALFLNIHKVLHMSEKTVTFLEFAVLFAMLAHSVLADTQKKK